MDIGKQIAEQIINEQHQLIGLYPGSFSPPHRGHLEVVKEALKQLDEVHIIISNKGREGYTPKISKILWEEYTKDIPNIKIKISTFPTPVTEVYKTIKDKTNSYLVLFGKGEKNRFNSINENREKYSNTEVVNAGKFGDYSATNLRKAIKENNTSIIKSLIPNSISVNRFLLLLQEIKIVTPTNYKKAYGESHSYNEFIKNQKKLNQLADNFLIDTETQKILASFTGWNVGRWVKPLEKDLPKYSKLSRSSLINPSPWSNNLDPIDPNNSNNWANSNIQLLIKKYQPINEIFDNKYQNILDKAIDYVCKDLQVEKPEIELVFDPEYTNQHTSFGGYVPSEKKIYAVVYNRNSADIMRSIAHELLHYKQDLDGRLTLEAGEDGDEFENEANSYSGKIMREIGRKFPEIFENKKSYHKTLGEIKVNNPTPKLDVT